MEKLLLSASSLPCLPSLSQNAINFVTCFERFGNLDEAGHELRGRTWKSIDVNGNKHVSLAEATLWIKTALMQFTHNKDTTDLLYRTFYPSFIRSFKDAADIGGSKKVAGVKGSDDSLEIGEFRAFTVFLCLYALMFDAFRFIDGSFLAQPHHQEKAGSVFGFGGAAPTHGKLDECLDEDRRLSLEEWRIRYTGLTGR